MTTDTVAQAVEAVKATAGAARDMPLEHGIDTSGLPIGSFLVTRSDLVANGQPSFDEWQKCGSVLRFIEGTAQWAIGDWYTYGPRIELFARCPAADGWT